MFFLISLTNEINPEMERVRVKHLSFQYVGNILAFPVRALHLLGGLNRKLLGLLICTLSGQVVEHGQRFISSG